jgi:hypothetical protein
MHSVFQFFSPALWNACVCSHPNWTDTPDGVDAVFGVDVTAAGLGVLVTLERGGVGVGWTVMVSAIFVCESVGGRGKFGEVLG